MRDSLRRLVLKAQALWLILAALNGLKMDIGGAFFGLAPGAKLFAGMPFSVLGFLEAHGLALILGLVLWRARPERWSHLTAAAIGGLLGGCNLAFWPLFGFVDALLMGYVATTLHIVLGGLNLAAAVQERTVEPRIVGKPAAG